MSTRGLKAVFALWCIISLLVLLILIAYWNPIVVCLIITLAYLGFLSYCVYNEFK